jgi:microcystin-dependent protein
MIGEIKLLPYGFAPQNYALCDGSILSIAQNQALFALLGTKYGGNGITDFALPNIAPVPSVDQPATTSYYICLQGS